MKLVVKEMYDENFSKLVKEKGLKRKKNEKKENVLISLKTRQTFEFNVKTSFSPYHEDSGEIRPIFVIKSLYITEKKSNLGTYHVATIEI